MNFIVCAACSSLILKGAKRKGEKLGRVFAEEGDVMEEHEREKVEQNALQVCVCVDRTITEAPS